MTPRSSVLLGLLAVALLVLPALPAQADHAPSHGVRVPLPRAGDQALYAYPGGDPAFAFEWLAREATLDRWGGARDAALLRTWLPAEVRDLAAPRDAWFQAVEAYAGGPSDPLWRASLDPWKPAATAHLPALRDGGQPASEQPSMTLTSYAPPPLVRSCLAHHGLQGRSVRAGDLVPFAVLCPAAGRLGVDAQAYPAERTRFQGGSAVALRYDITQAQGDAADILPRSGSVRVVLAEGSAFVAAFEASEHFAGGGWGYVLEGMNLGQGAGIPGWSGAAAAEPAQRWGARFAPLGADGPSEGGFLLPYRLQDALAYIRADTDLEDFHAWRDMHPDAAIVGLTFDKGRFLIPVEDGWTWAYEGWEIAWGATGTDGRPERYRITSVNFTQMEGLPLDWLVYNIQYGAEPSDGPAGSPQGARLMDITSAVRAWQGLRPQGADGPAPHLAYQGPGPGRPARYMLQPNWQELESGAPQEVLVLDAASGAVIERIAYHHDTAYAPLALTFRPTPVAAAADTPDLLALTLAAVLVAALAKSAHWFIGYTRLRQSDLLSHPHRRRIRQLLEEHPGMSIQQLADGVGLARTVTKYHLGALERGGVVTVVSLPGFKRYYLSGSVPPTDLRARAELQAGSAQLLYALVARQPGIGLTEVARQAGLSVPAAFKTVKRLEASGLVAKQRDAGRRGVHLVARAPWRN